MECEVYLDWMQLQQVSEFKWLGCVLNESGTGSIVGKWGVGGKLQVPLGLCLMLGLCSFSVQEFCMRHSSCLFLYMVVRQRYGKRRIGLGLGLYRMHE